MIGALIEIFSIFVLTIARFEKPSSDSGDVGPSFRVSRRNFLS